MTKKFAIDGLISYAAKKAIRAIREGRKTKADLYKLYNIQAIRARISLIEYTKYVDEFYAKVTNLDNSEESLIKDIKALWKLLR